MSEWIGWVTRLRRTLYARMEELSFRTGAATVAGVLAVAATAILLTLTQGGLRAVAPRAAQAGAAHSSLAVAPPMHAFSPSAAHPANRRRANAPFADYVPGPAKTPTTAPQPSPSPSVPSPRPTRLGDPRGTGTLRPTPSGSPWPWPYPSPSQAWPYNQPG